jgi:hypothetical protein
MVIIKQVRLAVLLFPFLLSRLSLDFSFLPPSDILDAYTPVNCYEGTLQLEHDPLTPE